MANRLPMFAPGMIEAISEVLAATDLPGLTSRELETALHRTGLTLDPAGSNKRTQPPMVQISPMFTASQISEHAGFEDLLPRIHGHCRNPRAHSSRHHNNKDLHALCSYVHCRLDAAGVRP